MIDDDEDAGPPRLAGGKFYMTPSGHERLRAELAAQRSERHRVVEIVAWAASNGDRSENADYKEGKRRLRQIDGRLRFLLNRLTGGAGVAAGEARRRGGGADAARAGGAGDNGDPLSGAGGRGIGAAGGQSAGCPGSRVEVTDPGRRRTAPHLPGWRQRSALADAAPSDAPLVSVHALIGCE